MKELIIKLVAPAAILATGLGAFVMLEAAKPEPEKKVEPPRPLSVYVEIAQRADVALLVSTEGEVRAKTQVNLVAQIAGRIVSVSSEFTEGGRVTPGETLISIEDTDYQLSLSQAQARVAEAEVGVQEAVASADVAKKQLRNANNASPLALKKPQVAQAKARLAAANAELAQAELNLTRTKISLPFKGRVTEKVVDIGQFVSPGTFLGKAFATDVVQIRVPLDDDELASLDLPIGFVATSSEPIMVNLSATVAGRVQQWQGKLERLDAAIDRASRTLFAMVEVEDPYGQHVSQNGMPLAVGLFVSAEIEGRNIQNATVIPSSALRAGDNVFVVNAESRLEIREVEVVHSSENDVIIGAGIEPEEQVIVSSIRNPIPGMTLSPLPIAARSQLASRGEY